MKNILTTAIFVMAMMISSIAFGQEAIGSTIEPEFDYIDLVVNTSGLPSTGTLNVQWHHNGVYGGSPWWVKKNFNSVADGRYTDLPNYAPHNWLAIIVTVMLQSQGSPYYYIATKHWNGVSAPTFIFTNGDFTQCRTVGMDNSTE